jgi:hypothetical protein
MNVLAVSGDRPAARVVAAMSGDVDSSVAAAGLSTIVDREMQLTDQPREPRSTSRPSSG